MTSNNKYLTNLFLNTFIFLITFLIFMIRVLLQLRPKKIEKALVSGNAGDVKNLPPGGRKFIFFYRFSGDILFSSLVSFVFFYYCFFLFVYLLLFEIENVYSDTHSTVRAAYSIACTYLETAEYQNAPAVLKLPIMLPTCVRAHAFIVFVIKDFTQLEWFIFLAKKIIKENVETFLTVLMNFFRLKMSPEN